MALAPVRPAVDGGWGGIANHLFRSASFTTLLVGGFSRGAGLSG